MTEPQDIANRVGAALRNAEAANAAGDTAGTTTQLAALHTALVDTFNYLNANGFGLSMDQITGNHPSTSALHTDGGGPKD